jgi:hypothetical protein|tara:strand:- start:383 stop:742 length:360 start_codon:yes stop_codon:yes gene_type:complete
MANKKKKQESLPYEHPVRVKRRKGLKKWASSKKDKPWSPADTGSPHLGDAAVDSLAADYEYRKAQPGYKSPQLKGKGPAAASPGRTPKAKKKSCKPGEYLNKKGVCISRPQIKVPQPKE